MKMIGHQKGTTLIISMVLLVIIGIVAIGSVGDVKLNQSMATNFRDSDVAFQAAEAALAEGEQQVESLFPSATEAEFVTNFLPSCSGPDCFSATCPNGLCFKGEYRVGQQCQRLETGASVWEDPGVWTDSARHFSANFTNPQLSESPKYIIEFLCYVPISAENEAIWSIGAGYAPDVFARFYRVTSYAKGMTDSSQVMLQSTYKHILN